MATMTWGETWSMLAAAIAGATFSSGARSAAPKDAAGADETSEWGHGCDRDEADSGGSAPYAARGSPVSPRPRAFIGVRMNVPVAATCRRRSHDAHERRRVADTYSNRFVGADAKERDRRRTITTHSTIRRSACISSVPSARPPLGHCAVFEHVAPKSSVALREQDASSCGDDRR